MVPQIMILLVKTRHHLQNEVNQIPLLFIIYLINLLFKQLIKLYFSIDEFTALWCYRHMYIFDHFYGTSHA